VWRNASWSGTIWLLCISASGHSNIVTSTHGRLVPERHVFYHDKRRYLPILFKLTRVGPSWVGPSSLQLMAISVIESHIPWLNQHCTVEIKPTRADEIPDADIAWAEMMDRAPREVARENKSNVSFSEEASKHCKCTTARNQRSRVLSERSDDCEESLTMHVARFLMKLYEIVDHKR